MAHHITALVADDETILLDGHEMTGTDALDAALRSALHADPDFILVIGSSAARHYKGIGTVLYASQRAGVPVENLRFTTEDGKVVSLDELRARDPRPAPDGGA